MKTPISQRRAKNNTKAYNDYFNASQQKYSMKTIYKADKNFLKVTPIEIESETDSFYREVGRGYRSAKSGSSFKCFGSHEEAVFYLQEHLEARVRDSERALNASKNDLSEFNKKHIL